jgi:hypothetical protein
MTREVFEVNTAFREGRRWFNDYGVELEEPI